MIQAEEHSREKTRVAEEEPSIQAVADRNFLQSILNWVLFNRGEVHERR